MKRTCGRNTRFSFIVLQKLKTTCGTLFFWEEKETKNVLTKRLSKRRFDLGAIGLFPICYQAFELGDKRMTAKEKTIFKLH